MRLLLLFTNRMLKGIDCVPLCKRNVILINKTLKFAKNRVIFVKITDFVGFYTKLIDLLLKIRRNHLLLSEKYATLKVERTKS